MIVAAMTRAKKLPTTVGSVPQTKGVSGSLCECVLWGISVCVSACVNSQSSSHAANAMRRQAQFNARFEHGVQRSVARPTIRKVLRVITKSDAHLVHASFPFKQARHRHCVPSFASTRRTEADSVVAACYCNDRGCGGVRKTGFECVHVLEPKIILYRGWGGCRWSGRCRCRCRWCGG